VSEVKRITLDAGQNMDRFESRYTVEGTAGPLSYAAGIKKQPGGVVVNGKDTGIMREPMMQVWVQDSVRPAAVLPERPGRWVAFPQWPHEAVAAKAWCLGAAGLTRERQQAATRIIDSPLETGLTFGEWCPYSSAGELPADQLPREAELVSM